jgi:hypothetical protein
LFDYDPSKVRFADRIPNCTSYTFSKTSTFPRLISVQHEARRQSAGAAGRSARATARWVAWRLIHAFQS